MNQRLQNVAIIGLMLLIGFVAFWKVKAVLAWAVVPCLIVIPWMLGDPKRLLAGYWVWASVSEYAYQVTGSGSLRYGDEVLLVVLVIALVFLQAVHRKVAPDLRQLMAVFMVLMVIFVVSFLVNRPSFIDAAITAVQYLRPFVLGYFAYLMIEPEDLPGVAKFFILTLLAQLAMNLGWFFEINPLRHPGIFVGVDFAVGTMGNAQFVGYTACLGMVLSIAIFLVMRLQSYLFLTGVLAVSFVFTNTAHAYAFLLLMLIIMGSVYSKGAPVRLIGVSLAAVPLISVLILIQVLSPLTLQLDTYLKRGGDLLTGRKVAAYKSHLLELPFDSSVPLFLVGTGPGTLGTAMADQRGYMAAKYHGWDFTGAEALEVATSSIIMVTRTGFLAIWSDLGPLAFLLYWGSHFWAIRRVIRLYRASKYELPWQQAFALSFIPAMMLYLLVAFMTDLVHTALWGCVPWVWASMVWSPQAAVRPALGEKEVGEVGQAETVLISGPRVNPIT